MSDPIWLPLFTRDQDRALSVVELTRTSFGRGLFESMMERIEWVKENSVYSFEISKRGIFFDNPDDAFAYRMRWL